MAAAATCSCLLKSLNPTHQDILFSGREILAGRHPKCTVVLSDLRISQLHAQVRSGPEASAHLPAVVDLSTNGTFVNGELVGKGKTRVLHNDDLLSFVVTPRREGNSWTTKDPTMRSHFIAYKICIPPPQASPPASPSATSSAPTVASHQPPTITPPSRNEAVDDRDGHPATLPAEEAGDANGSVAGRHAGVVEVGDGGVAGGAGDPTGDSNRHAPDTGEGAAANPPAVDTPGEVRADALERWLAARERDGRKSRFEDDFVMGELLGTGGFGEVCRATHKATGTAVAVKKVDKGKMKMKNMYIRESQMDDEFKIHALCSHPNVVRFYAMYQDSKFIYLVLEHVEGGELYDLLSDYSVKRQKVPEGTLRRMFRPLMEAVEYMHNDLHICHRDLKPENILMTDTQGTSLKIADFGLAKMLGAETRGVTKVGTTAYMAPEVAGSEKEGGEGYGTGADIWGMGVVLFVMCSCTLPFDDSDEVIELRLQEMQGQSQIPTNHEGKGLFQRPEWDTVSEDARDLVRWMLT
eukprot:CAMPEP_0173428774 /NCGR_PEP_ID=MMETSP1357-20121228/7650_1 /TAXON_ID=77926 /ORGANISM="Hemiselmis rufescens, Strain PCC563" /LENGTH=522 /DNA_ID=CAMNT_0014392843 /DNA_START=8 /DNA_END=1573 /DNA_ORIENTATION=-